MTMQYTPNLGEIPAPDARRDAVHVAVAPVVAKHDLNPGDHVGLFPDGQAGYAGEHIGAVDPFLRNPVKAGERCWLFLYPNTVTSLRHSWTHPAFTVKPLEALP